MPFTVFCICKTTSTVYYSVSAAIGESSKEKRMSTTKGFIAEFREFAVKGNMMDLAVGVIIGAAFGKIIDSLVKDVVMPVISFILGGKVDRSEEHTSELQSLMRISYAVFCLKKKTK